MDVAAAAVFVEVVRVGSVTAAAQHLNVTKSAVSKRLAQLESSLGVRLLERTTRSLSLTEAGGRFLEHAASAMEAMHQAELAATELQDKPSGHLRVLSLMSFGCSQVAPLLHDFVELYPLVTVALVLDDQPSRLLDGDFDVALRAGPLPEHSLVSRKLAVLHSGIFASPTYLKHHGTPQKPTDLNSRNCLTYSYSPEPSQWVFRRQGITESIEVSGGIQVNNGDALCELTAAGAGICRLPIFVAAPHVSSKRLVRVLDPYTMPSKDLRIVFRERTYLPPKVRVFVDFLVDRLGGET